jgi:hypothetical protein
LAKTDNMTLRFYKTKELMLIYLRAVREQSMHWMEAQANNHVAC